MKIQYIISDYPKFSETFIKAEVEQLVEKGYQVEVLSLIPRSKSKSVPYVFYNTTNPLKLLFAIFWAIGSGKSSLLDRELWQSIWYGIKKEPSSLFSWIYLLLSLDYVTRSTHRSKSDYLFTHFMFKGAFVCSIVARKLDLPYHLRVHTNYSNLSAGIQKKLVLNADGISTISNHTATYLAEVFGIKGVPVIRQSLLSQNFPTEIRLKKERKGFRLVCAGRFIEKKGFHYLIKALAQMSEEELQNIELHIFGEGRLAVDYKELIRTYELDNVFVRPRLKHDALMKELAAADLLVVPSVSSQDDVDGIPTVIPEAMIMGVPVIATPVGGIKELVEDGITGYVVDSHQPDLLVNGIRQALSDEKNWFNISRQARIKALKEYEFNLSDRLEENIYQK